MLIEEGSRDTIGVLIIPFPDAFSFFEQDFFKDECCLTSTGAVFTPGVGCRFRSLEKRVKSLSLDDSAVIHAVTF